MKSDRALNVFYIVDKDYLIHFTVSLTSLLENNKDINISVHVIHDIGDIDKVGIVAAFFFEKYSIKINVIRINNKIFNDFPDFPVSKYISKAAYFKLLLADIIPLKILSGLYIDCDTVVTGSLKKLINLDFFALKESNEEYSLLAVNDKNEDTEIERLNNLGIKSQFYFNSGVMIVNLKKWREDQVSSKLLKIAEEYKNHLLWLDQDVLNIYFKNECGKLDTSYNRTVTQKLSETPLIIHFSGSSKPWHYFNTGPYKSLYWKYLRVTPFKNEKFEKITVEKTIKKYLQLITKR